MILDMPDTVDGSFYLAQVYVGVKDLILEPLSPLHHVIELFNILQSSDINKPVLFLYTDGGSDHRLTYLSIQLAFLCMFIARDFDMLVAARTPPMSTWKNPPEELCQFLTWPFRVYG